LLEIIVSAGTPAVFNGTTLLLFFFRFAILNLHIVNSIPNGAISLGRKAKTQRAADA